MSLRHSPDTNIESQHSRCRGLMRKCNGGKGNKKRQITQKKKLSESYLCFLDDATTFNHNLKQLGVSHVDKYKIKTKDFKHFQVSIIIDQINKTKTHRKQPSIIRSNHNENTSTSEIEEIVSNEFGQTISESDNNNHNNNNNLMDEIGTLYNTRTQLLQLQQPSINAAKPGITTPLANENDEDDAKEPGITLVTSSQSISTTSNVRANANDAPTENDDNDINVPHNIHQTNVPQNIYNTHVPPITNVPQNIHDTNVPQNADADADAPPITNIPTINVPPHTNEPNIKNVPAGSADEILQRNDRPRVTPESNPPGMEFTANANKTFEYLYNPRQKWGENANEIFNQLTSGQNVLHLINRNNQIQHKHNQIHIQDHH